MRGTGQTTQQLKDAAQGSYFVWCNCDCAYPRQLAASLGRGDIKVVSPHWLTDRTWAGSELAGLVIDHAAFLTDEQRDMASIVHTRVKPVLSARGAEVG